MNQRNEDYDGDEFRKQKRIKLQEHHFRPSQMTAKDYYEHQSKNNETERQLSRIIEVKKFQNWIKAVMINQASLLVQDELKKKVPMNILELGCGKGGDLKKWAYAGIGVWFGLDISGSSLEEALNRYKASNYDFIIHLIQMSADSTIFQTMIPQEIYFDIVSIQFVANLMFSSSEAVDHLLENITCRLAKNGLLLMTVTDANVLVKKLREQGTKNNEGLWVYGNEHFQIQFDQLEFKGNPYGIKYNFYLEDSVGEKDPVTGKITFVPEYLIELREFKEKAEKYGLEIVENLNFTEVYQKYNEKYFDMMKKIMNIGQNEWTMKNSHWEISHLYRYIILKHKKGMEQFKVQRKKKLSHLQKQHIELQK